MRDLAEFGLIRGQVGTIVEVLGPEVFEVEFSDDNGRTYATVALKGSDLLRFIPPAIPSGSLKLPQSPTGGPKDSGRCRGQWSPILHNRIFRTGHGSATPHNNFAECEVRQPRQPTSPAKSAERPRAPRATAFLMRLSTYISSLRSNSTCASHALTLSSAMVACVIFSTASAISRASFMVGW